MINAKLIYFSLILTKDNLKGLRTAFRVDAFSKNILQKRRYTQVRKGMKLLLEKMKIGEAVPVRKYYSLTPGTEKV